MKTSLDSSLSCLLCLLFQWLGLIVWTCIWKRRRWYNNVQFLYSSSGGSWGNEDITRKNNCFNSPEKDPGVEIVSKWLTGTGSKHIRWWKQQAYTLVQRESGLNLTPPIALSPNDNTKLSHLEAWGLFSTPHQTVSGCMQPGMGRSEVGAGRCSRHLWAMWLLLVEGNSFEKVATVSHKQPECRAAEDGCTSPIKRAWVGH